MSKAHNRPGPQAQRDGLDRLASNTNIEGMAFLEQSTLPKAEEYSEVPTLQIEQMRHDVGYHGDILALPVDRRMSHMSLHMCKYSGQFLQAEREEDAARFAHTLTDALIITLASANALDIDLSTAPTGTVLIPDTRGRPIAASRTNERDWFTYRFAAVAARLAKAAESQDHKEQFPIVETMKVCIVAFFYLVMSEARHRRLDAASLVRTRWTAVERKIDIARLAANT